MNRVSLSYCTHWRALLLGLLSETVPSPLHEPLRCFAWEEGRYLFVDTAGNVICTRPLNITFELDAPQMLKIVERLNEPLLFSVSL